MPNKILVVGSRFYANPVKDLGEVTADVDEFILRPDKFALILLTGGADVSPSLYGDVGGINTKMCNSDIGRDMYEKGIYNHARRNGIKITGICRGLQFINVMEGGKLVHHMDGHEGCMHDFGCLKDNKIRSVNSIHHQMILPPKEGITIGWSTTKLSEIYFGNRDKSMDWCGPEVEAAIYPKAKACGVQWHPELMSKNSPGRLFFTNMIYNLLHLSMDSFVSTYTGENKAVEAM